MCAKFYFSRKWGYCWNKSPICGGFMKYFFRDECFQVLLSSVFGPANANVPLRFHNYCKIAYPESAGTDKSWGMKGW